MSAQSAPSAPVVAVPNQSWVPMIAIALGQVLMSFNVASLPVAMSGMVNSFSVPPTTVATGIVDIFACGCRLRDARRQAQSAFRLASRLSRGRFAVRGRPGADDVEPQCNPDDHGPGVVRLGGAALVPSLVALIAENYKGTQQATAVGALGSARAGAGVAAFTIGGILGTFFAHVRRSAS